MSSDFSEQEQEYCSDDLQEYHPNHSGVYKCKHCHKKFRQKRSLDCHVCQHSINQPNRCDPSPKSFISKTKSNGLRKCQANEGLLKGSLECKQCDRIFVCNRDFNYHLYKHTGVKPFKCNHCLKSYTSYYYMKYRHWCNKTEANIGKATAVQCSRTKANRSKLTAVQRNKTKAKRSKATTAQSSFIPNVNQKSMVKRRGRPAGRHGRTNETPKLPHRKPRGRPRKKINVSKCSVGDNQEMVVLLSKPVQCERCDQWLPARSALLDHMKRHTEMEMSGCSEPGEEVSQKSTLQRHARKHSNIESYKCRHCQKNLSSDFSRKRHERLHTGVGLFSCNNCDKKFLERRSLRRHLHNRSCVLPCHADSSDHSTDDHNTHVTRQQPGEHDQETASAFSSDDDPNNVTISPLKEATSSTPSSTPCSTPSRRSTRRPCSTVKRYEDFECDSISATPNDQSNVAVTYDCALCEESFENIHILRQHVKSHDEGKSFECDLCEEVFTEKRSLEEHLNAHAGIKPYGCEKCSKQFSYHDALVKHRHRCSKQKV